MKLRKQSVNNKNYSLVQLYVGEGCSASASGYHCHISNGNCGCNH